MMVKMEEGLASELPPTVLADPKEHYYSSLHSPVDGGGDDYDYDDEEEDDDEETDDEGDGYGARRSGAPPLKKGPWTPDEDKRLRDYVRAHGEGNWNQVRINAGLNRCGKSCRLRWSNHLRPDLKKGPFDDDEVEKILRMHMTWGNKWAKMAALLPGRTDNEIKNYWNTRLKRHQRAGLPIYPEYLVSQASNQDMNFETHEELCGVKRLNESSQRSVLEIGDLMYDYFDHETFIKLMSNGDVPSSSLVDPNALPIDAVNPLKRRISTDSIASDYNGSLPFLQTPDESENAGSSTGFNYGMTENQLAPLGAAIISGHPIFDGNPSTSWTTQRPVKIELPSVQYSNYGHSNAWVCDGPSGSPIEQANTLIESPGSLKSESISPQNAGLDAIVHMGDDPVRSQGIFEVSVPPFSYNQISQSVAYAMRHSFSSAPGDDEIDGCPPGVIHSKSPSSSDAIFAESSCYPDTIFTGKFLSWANYGAVDASVEAGAFNELFSKDQSIYNSHIDGDSCEEAEQSNAGRGLFSWKSMPGACNMSDSSNQ
ncbi:hypothetical protein EJB05_41505 [Eragrostis curvula]|uniref:Transcription factor n=1 Tax=Eragrostis curvula TaxID=38414 RepID=A0A5J9TAX6_9POAL|nr:hypothetical protein EJB05_41491 [Eragrostis curvula]TVU08118.1 hypothetical protein EJB05_41505 [Eragrostis curvula]